MNRKYRPYLFLILLPIAVLSVAPSKADSFEKYRVDDRSYRLHAPEERSSDSLSLVVMLYECTQSSRQFASEARMNRLAVEGRFLVLSPNRVRAARR